MAEILVRKPEQDFECHFTIYESGCIVIIRVTYARIF